MEYQYEAEHHDLYISRGTNKPAIYYVTTNSELVRLDLGDEYLAWSNREKTLCKSLLEYSLTKLEDDV